MTLNTTYSPAVADGNGVTKQFSYSFNPISINYLKVSLEISGQWVQQLSGWTATVSENGGIVTFDVAPTTRVAIERDVPEEQPTSYETSSGFQAKVIEHSFDMLTGMVQELKEKSDRSVSVEVGSPISPEQVVQQIERVYTSIDNVDAVADDLANVDAVAVDLTNINKVAGSITNVNKVGNSITKVNTVAGSIAKVGTVADNISDVNAVGGDITKVKAVADDLTNIDKVANNETNINKVASIDSDVSAVAGIKNDVSTVSSISGNVTSVAGNSTNVTKVATNISNVNKVGDAISNVNKVGNNIADVNDVADDLANIDIVAGDIADVSAVGGNILNVTAVANDLTNIDAVAGNRTNINTVATNNTNVSRVGSNINNVNSVANNETNINTIASNISDVSNVASYLGNISTVADGMTEVQAVADDLSNIDGVSQYLGQIENVSDNITNVNAVGSNISNVNTVAGDHANIQTVVNNMTAINNAPTYANNSKIWAEGLDGEVAPLGGTHSSKGWAEIAEQAASGVQNPANRDLSNLTNTGQMIIDSVNGYISNCILEIPQNLKLTLENNVLTLKSGSILTKTGDTYTTITINADRTVTIGTNATWMVFATSNGTSINNYVRVNRVGSGSSLPADNTDYTNFFLTTDKNIYYYDSGIWKVWNVTYPLCIINVVNGVASFAKDSNGNDMIFNGAGFIGHHAFVYPNVEGLLTSRFNDDGSLKSVLRANDALRIVELTQNYNTLFLNNYTNYINTQISGDDVNSYSDITQEYVFHYVKDSNIWGRVVSGANQFAELTKIADYSYNGTTVTDFAIHQPVRLATTEMLDKVQDQVDTKQDTLVSGTNIKTINSTSVLGSGNFTLADQSLSNLDSTGQMVVDSQNGTISNCILEIPQNLKLTLENDVVTLKAGSEPVVANGDTYTTQTVLEDVSRNFSTWGGQGLFYVVYQTNNTLTLYSVPQTGSGATLPEDGTTYNRFYLTTDKRLYAWDNNQWNAQNACYPLCVVEKTGTSVTFAKDSNGNDMIFNGAGYIGHHAFVYPNVKALLPNEFNEDGSLKSREVISDSLTIFEMIAGDALGLPRVANIDENRVVRSSNYREMESIQDIIDSPAKYYDTYIPSLNGVYLKESNDTITRRIRTYILKYSYNGTTVTDFTIRQPYEGARNLLTDDIEEQIDTKANDSDVLHKTGNETVAGEKTFTSIPAFKHDASAIRLLNPNATKGTAPSSNKYGYVEYLDKNGSGNANRIGLLEFSQKPNGDTVTLIAAYKDVASGTERAEIDIVQKRDGTTFATCPTPAISDDSNKIVTTEWFNDKLVLVNELPANPDSSVWYAIPEEE